MAALSRPASVVFRRATSKRHLHHVFRAHIMETLALGRDGQLAAAIDAEWSAVSTILQSKMRTAAYSFTSYREILLSKGARSAPRVVSVPTARDRIVLKALAGMLKELFPSATTPMAQVRVSELVDAMAVTQFDTYVRVDVKDFYPSISHRAILHQLRKKIRKPELLTLLTRAISTPTVSLGSPRPGYSNLYGVPQGLSISNSLAEIAMTDIDAHYRSHPSATYFRYVDDILVLCRQHEANDVFTDLKERFAAIGLSIHELGAGSKSEIGNLAKSFDYLGYRFQLGIVSVRRSSVQRLESTLVQLFTSYKYQTKNADKDWQDKARVSLARRLDLVIAGCVFENVPRGWIHYFSQMNDMTLLSGLDSFLSKLIARFDLPGTFKPKSFVRAFWHVSRPNADSPKYIPNFDRYKDVDKRLLLEALFPGQPFGHLTDGEISKRFTVEIRRLVSMLERDISEIS
jgi:RNA-directed DNA polymerase